MLTKRGIYCSRCAVRVDLYAAAVSERGYSSTALSEHLARSLILRLKEKSRCVTIVHLVYSAALARKIFL